MIPNPPICMSSMMTTSPKSEKSATSRLANPVTVAADVAMNSALSNPMVPLASLATGRESNTDPATMRLTNAPTTSRAG